MTNKTTAALVSAAAALAVFGGISSAAFAQTRTTAAAREEQRMTRERDQADREIDVRVRSLQTLGDRVDRMKVSSTTKSMLSNEVQTEISDLSALKARIGSDASTTLTDDLKSITQSYRVYALMMPRITVLAAVDRVQGVAQALTTIQSKLQTLVNSTTLQGNDAASAQNLFADMQSKINSANTSAQAAQNEVAGLKPDNGDKTTMQANLAALKDARSKIVSAQHDLNAARKDAGEIRRLLPRGNESATTTPTTATSSNQ